MFCVTTRWLLAYSKNAKTVTLGVAREVVNDYREHPPAVEPIGSVAASRRAESAIRPRRTLVRATGACAALAIVGFGSVLIAGSA